MAQVKKLVPLIIVIFVLYSILNSPQKSADVVHTVISILIDGVNRIFTFFGALVGK